MKEQRYLIAGTAILLLIVLGAGLYFYNANKSKNAPLPEEGQVRTTVTSFGDQLQNVPLVASSTIVAFAMDKYYAFYVRPDTLAAWKADPLHAPGRLTSSPWPDSIDIESVKKTADGTYTVEAFIVMASNGANGNLDKSLDKVDFMLAHGPDGWQITGFQQLPD